MPSENVYVVTCHHFDDQGEGTEVVRIFISRTDANEHARAYLNEQYGDDWEEYEETMGSDGSISIHAEGGENEVLDMNVKVYRVVFDESQQRNRNSTSTMAAEQVYVVMCDSRGDSGEGTDILAIYKSLENANHFALRYLKNEYGEDFEYEEYEEDTSDETVTVTATGWENDTLEIYVVVRDLLP